MKLTKDKQPIPLRLWYDEEAPKDNEGSPAATWQGGEDKGWERWSLPIGNGYFGANIFGRTESERIQISEKTLRNIWSVTKDEVSYNVGGMNNFSETYIDFNHVKSEVTDYIRYLNMETAVSGVEYSYNSVRYTREYFVSYPDKAIVIRLDSDSRGKLDFVLRPTIPYKQSYGGYKGDGVTKEGTVKSCVINGVGHIELAGKMGFYDVDFLGLYRVYTDGGNVQATTVDYTYNDKDGTSITDTNGTITVTGANSAYIVITLGTDYELTSELFNAPDNNKPTKNTTLEDTRIKVEGYMSAIDSKLSGKTFNEAYIALKETHIADHRHLFGRVSLDLDCKSTDYVITTDKLIENYKQGIDSTYLETLLFQYGRYLLIASSREETLPPTLQGVWNTYNIPPWASDYTHNINLQMNYWPAFSTNLAETFEAYVNYNRAYMEKAKRFADEIVNQYNPSVFGRDGGNGWVIGAHIDPYKMTGGRSAGELGFTTQLFWEYYAYTKDPDILKKVYEILVDAARYITKCVELDEDGNYMVSYSDSPEMYVDGVWYYTIGTTYAQSFAYQNNYNALCAAKELGIDLNDTKLLTKEEYSVLNRIMEQIEKYDPIHIGYSGQIKEFRKEDFYCSIGDEYHHRHTSQLVGLYPGDLINSTTPAWLDGAKVTLVERGSSGSGWGVAFRQNQWARIKDGNQTYTLLQTFLKENIASNLWCLHPPFQIDGNFGATAGISEMLLQSHEGYIAPLAAIPDSWMSGSYSGLVARGGFEVSCNWLDGVISEMTIYSKKGGEVKISYPSINKTKLYKDDGSQMNFVVIDDNLISFDTEVGETYHISEFTKVLILDEPKKLRVVEPSQFTFDLSWNKVEGATAYNIYVAVENAPLYTCIGSSNDTNFVYKNSRDERLTFAVTAVNKNRIEGKRALCYTVPSRETPYGVIPAKNVAIPFALFVEQDEKYLYVDSFMDYKEAVSAANVMAYNDSTLTKVVIYLARNHSIDSGSLLVEEMPRVNEFIFDLGNRILELESPLLDFSVEDDGATIARNVTVTGGNIRLNSRPLFVLSTEHGALNLTFKNVRFARRLLPTGIAPVFVCKETGNSSETANITFECCRIDFNTEPQQVILFDVEGSIGNYKFNFNGGEILVKSLEKFHLLSKEECENISIEFVKDVDEKQTLLKLTEINSNEISLPKYINETKAIRTGQKKVHLTRITQYEFVK